jgi:hypothetical protein
MMEHFLNALGALGKFLQTPEGQGAAALWSVAIGALGWFVRRLFYPAQQFQRLAFTTLSRNVIGSAALDIPGLQVLVNGVSQSSVSVTDIVVWNQGSKAIRKDDAAQSDPIEIVAPAGTKLLCAEVYATTRSACNISIGKTASSNKISFMFDFLAGGDGAILRVAYEGSQARERFRVQGTFIDAGPISYSPPGDAFRFVEGNPFNFKSPRVRSVLVGLLILIVGVASSLLIFSRVFPEWASVGYVFFMMIWLFAVLRVLRHRGEITRSFVPRKFEDLLFGFSSDTLPPTRTGALNFIGPPATSKVLPGLPGGS